MQTMVDILPRNPRGAGRPKGTHNAETILRLKQKKLMDRRIFRMAEKLISAQAIVAVGTHKMVRTFLKEGVPTVETIRDEKRMQDLLDTGVYGKDYIIVVGTLPDAKAANMLLDRGFGKAKETIELEGEVKFSLKGLHERRAAIEAEVISRDVIENSPEKLLEVSANENPDE